MQFQFSVCMYGTCGRIDNKADFDFDFDSGRFDPEDIQLKIYIEFSEGMKLCKCVQTLKIHIIYFFINYVLRDISI